ncbi:MAG: hypothetical protein KBS74_00895 [Clostridiales bacterium]|nr:hypothetical protein [Candidatus Cacconaster stercorequi]
MKRAISILLAITLLFTLATGCGQKEAESSVTEVKVTLPCSTGTRAIVEGEAVIATQAYLLARAYFEKLETYDMDSFHAQEYRDLLAKALEAFQIAEALCDSFKGHAGALAKMEENESAQNASAQQEKAAYELLSVSTDSVWSSSFVPVAYAAEEKSPAVRYAEELTKTFDHAKNGQKLKAVAEKYGTDVKKAKAMLDQAQAILEGAAYEKQAAFENKCYEVAVETKAAASTIGFGVAVAATGGIAAGGVSAAGIMEAGGLAFSGVSAVIDMGTAVTIHTTHGEGNEYTTAWEKTAEMVAPVSTVFAIGGGIQNIKDFRDPEKAAEAIDNAAQAFLVGLGLARDYVQDGTVLGVSSNIIDGYREIIVRSADTATPEAAKEVLMQTGISEEALDVTSTQQPQDGHLGAEADVYIEAMGALADPENPINMDAVLKNVDQAFSDRAADEGTDVGDVTEPVTDPATQPASDDPAAPHETEPNDTENKVPADKEVLPAADVVGTYAFPGADDTWTQTVTMQDDTHLKFTDDDGAAIVGRYNEKTGVFSYSDENGDFTVSIKVTFTRAGNGIKADMVLTLAGETATSSAMKE